MYMDTKTWNTLRFVASQCAWLLICILLNACISDPFYENEGPYLVTLNLSHDSCEFAFFRLSVDDLPFGSSFVPPKSFRTTEGRHYVYMWCPSSRTGVPSEIVWNDTIDIVSDTSFVVGCLNCQMQE